MQGNDDHNKKDDGVKENEGECLFGSIEASKQEKRNSASDGFTGKGPDAVQRGEVGVKVENSTTIVDI